MSRLVSARVDFSGAEVLLGRVSGGFVRRAMSLIVGEAAQFYAAQFKPFPAIEFLPPRGRGKDGFRSVSGRLARRGNGGVVSNGAQADGRHGAPRLRKKH